MRFSRFVGAIALALCLFVPSSRAVAQPLANTVTTWLWQYNLNQTVTPIYCALDRTKPLTIADPVQATASTTVTAVSGTPFLGVSVGAMLHFTDNSLHDVTRTVTVRNSSTSVVVSGGNITLSNARIQTDSFNVACGTGVDSGAFSVAGYNKFEIGIDITQQVNTGGIQFHIQCRASADAGWIQVSPTLVWPTTTSSYEVAKTDTGSVGRASQDPFFQCRVGMFIVTADDGNDLTTNAEQVSIKVTGRSN